MPHISTALQTIAGAALLLTTGCAPSVSTRIQKSYPARIEGSTVLVYTMTDSLPEPTEVLGSVRVKDSGFSINCNYEQVMQLAKNETNKAGGNGLRLTEHKEPTALGSTCHRIAADILLLPDSAYTATYFDNIAVQNARSTIYGYPNNYAPQHSERKPYIETGRNTFVFNIGYGLITSDYYVPDGVSGNPKQGLDVGVGYQWTSKQGFGFGLRYSGYFSSVESGAAKMKIGLHYFAPEFVLRQDFGRRWLLRESIGIGYARYVEKLGSISAGIGGFGYHMDLGIEYKLSRYVGIGVGIGLYGTRFSSMDEIVGAYSDKEKAGIARINLNGGLRFYF